MIQIVLDSEMSFFKLSWMILKDFGSLNDLAFKCFSLRSISTKDRNIMSLILKVLDCLGLNHF